jgi:hypothetical protein
MTDDGKIFKTYNPSGKHIFNVVIGDAMRPTKINLSAENLRSTDIIGKSDPYFIIFTKNGKKLYRSEIVNNTGFPIWQEANFDVPVNGENLIVKIFDSDVVSDDLMASCQIPINDDLTFGSGVYYLEKSATKEQGEIQTIEGSSSSSSSSSS